MQFRAGFTVGIKLLNSKTFSVAIYPQDTVGHLKQRIFEREGIPSRRQNLLVMGKQLQPDTRFLYEFNIKPSDMIHVTAGLRGPLPMATETTSETTPVTNSTLVNQENSTGNKSQENSQENEKKTEKTDDKKDDKKKSDPKNEELPPVPCDMPSTNIVKSRIKCIQSFCTVTKVLQPKQSLNDEPHKSTNTKSTSINEEIKKIADSESSPLSPEQAPTTSKWSQNFWLFNRTKETQKLQGIVTCGLSNPYKNEFYFVIGLGIELMMEAPEDQVDFEDPKTKEITNESVYKCWLFQIVKELANQCFALGLQIRQLLENMHQFSAEIQNINLPEQYMDKYIDPDTKRCCVLVGHLGDLDLPRGFNVTVNHNNTWIAQTILLIPVRLLTFEQCSNIRKNGPEGRKSIISEFCNNKSFSVNNFS